MKNITYSDLLHDIKFIRWQLVPDEQLDNYWKELIELNPDWIKRYKKPPYI